MSDEGERTCPLCAEEMDLTDQQLKPCKCGYEICVWCWHHILDMAEKDDTGGRCPACRVPYDKEKIVGMAANCERLVAETNMERKMRNQKAKSKLSEGRKQLSSVRVIQRNLVYIVGLPLNLADEDLLQRQEYFGQYGKVLKVSVSRTAAGVIQQFPNSTCSVYITYSKEDEAIRCIQSVHGFVLEGRALRACFGTTKYCHAWLRNVPCGNPDCLYLHEVGSQEDSFTKDEIISAYTRSRVQQITGATNNMQPRSGNVFPPPVDDYMNHSSGKPIAKNASSNSSSNMKGSPPNGSSGRSIALPAAAAWGTRATSCQHHAGGLLCPNGPSKTKPDTVSSAQAFSSAVAGTIQPPALHSGVTQTSTSSDRNHIMLPGVKNDLLNPVKQDNIKDNLFSAGEKTAMSNISSTPMNLNSQISSKTLSRDGDSGSCTTANTTNSTDITRQMCRSDPEEAITAINEEIPNLCSDLSSINIDRDVQNEHHGITKCSSPPSDSKMIKSSLIQGLQNDTDKFRDAAVKTVASKAASDNGVCVPGDQCDWRLYSQAHLVSNATEVEDDIASFDNQRLKDPELCRSHYLPKSASVIDVFNHSSPHLLQHGEPCTAMKSGSLSEANKVVDDSLLHVSSLFCNGYPEKLFGGSSNGLNSTIERSLFLQDERNEQCIRRFPSEAVNVRSDAAVDKGESSIISNILAMDFDPWEDSLASQQNLAKFLGNNTDNQFGPLKKPNSWKVQNNNQSRFSFARQEESKIQIFDALPSVGVGEQMKAHSLIQDFTERDWYLHKLGIGDGFHTSNPEESENLSSIHSVTSSNKLSVVSRAQITAPPGFSVPSRAPPPGFSSHQRVEQAHDSISGNSLFESSSLLRNSYQMPTPGNIGGAGDIEFNDPAILAVGKGRLDGALNSNGLDMRSNFPPQFNYFENEARLQLLMQQPLSQQQNLRFSELGNTCSQLSDSYGLLSRLDESQVSNLVPFPQLSSQQSRNAAFSNGQWVEWNEVHSGNSLDVAELLRNERFGLNKLYSGFEDSKYRMQNSGDLYNRTYGM